MTHPLPTPDPWLAADAAWLRPMLDLPELALVDESCAAQTALHAARSACRATKAGC